jgi:hypothetical protein
MLERELCNYAEKLANFIRGKNFAPVAKRKPYYHMGATITDSILQAGLNYHHVVYPRVLKLLTKYPDYKTTCDFIILMQVVPLTELIAWKNPKKLQRIKDLTWFLYNNGIENEDQLVKWLDAENNVNRLRGVDGIGPKTIDYLKILAGDQAIAIDRHLFAFLELAGIPLCSYQEASLIYGKAAELLDIGQYELDKKVWMYMTKA